MEILRSKLDMDKMKSEFGWTCVRRFVLALPFMLVQAPMAAEALQPEKHVLIQKIKKDAAVPETLYGVFFEDINFAADGGLYAELVKNRSFEFDDPFMGWKVSGEVTVRNDGPFKNNPHYVRLMPVAHKWRQTSLQNEGFCGIGLKKDSLYHFSVWARSVDGNPQSVLVELGESDSDRWGQVVAAAECEVTSAEWKKYTVSLVPSHACEHAFLRIFLKGKGGVDLEHVSLFPDDVWKHRPNGMRRDLVEALAELKPGVFRFPGGCVVEGTELSTRYQWKRTLGPVENRPVMENRWHFTFLNRYYPDYYQSHGIGFYEFFLLAEDLGAAPLPVLNVGMICQYMADSVSQHAPLDSLQGYIQDALDLIEFANGDTLTYWGKVRASLGHPAPFGMKYLGIGNEQWGPEYVERLSRFVSAIRKEHPEIQIIGSSGPKPDGADFDYLWPEMTRLKVDLVDEHFYKDEEWFASQAGRYDRYSRKGPKVFAGEYACHCKLDGRNRFDASLLEAAFMTGIDRNSDIVPMATYAPLFAHYKAWQWRPDLIWFDNLRVVRSASYHVQKLFSHYKGTERLKLTSDGKPLSGGTEQDSLYASAVWDAERNAYILKVVNLSDDDHRFSIAGNSIGKERCTEIERIELTASAAFMDNTLDDMDAVVPVKSSLPGGQLDELSLQVKPHSLTIFVLYKINN